MAHRPAPCAIALAMCLLLSAACTSANAATGEGRFIGAPCVLLRHRQDRLLNTPTVSAAAAAASAAAMLECAQTAPLPSHLRTCSEHPLDHAPLCELGEDGLDHRVQGELPLNIWA